MGAGVTMPEKTIAQPSIILLDKNESETDIRNEDKVSSVFGCYYSTFVNKIVQYPAVFKLLVYNVKVWITSLNFVSTSFYMSSE